MATITRSSLNVSNSFTTFVQPNNTNVISVPANSYAIFQILGEPGTLAVTIQVNGLTLNTPPIWTPVYLPESSSTTVFNQSSSTGPLIYSVVVFTNT
jgi:hypothetical protein